MPQSETKKFSENEGSQFHWNGKTIRLQRHETDYMLRAASERPNVPRPSRHAMERRRAESIDQREAWMSQDRAKGSVAYHVYTNLDDPNEEILIDETLELTPEVDDPDFVNRIASEHKLNFIRKMGRGYIFAVTKASGANPIKIANRISEVEGIRSANPLPLLQMRLMDSSTHDLVRRQWHLESTLLSSAALAPGADIDCLEAWNLVRPDPAVVIAVIDDGFDLDHPSLRDAPRHPQGKDLDDGDSQPQPGADSYHGTPVAALALASGPDSSILGVAPGCTFLPIRIPFGRPFGVNEMLGVFEFASRHADIVNCSFGFPPTSFNPISDNFSIEMERLTLSGGRRGKGLIIVFAAGNDDAPTYLPGALNRNGVQYQADNGASIIPAGHSVYTGYPIIPGVVVVAAMSSRKRKSAFSNWGPHITLAAPSNNYHPLSSLLEDFEGSYPGLGLLTSTNRANIGQPFNPMRDNPSTTLDERQYTSGFGGTSGATPIVAGVCALILSANPDLNAAEVIQILRATADKDLDPETDLAADPNLQGRHGRFVNSRSDWFGAGKVNARRAVEKALSLRRALSSVRRLSAGPQRMDSSWSPSVARNIALEETDDPNATFFKTLGQLEIQSAELRENYRQRCCDRAADKGHPVPNPSAVLNGIDDTISQIGLSLYREAT